MDIGSGRGTDVLRMAGAVGSKGFVYGIDVAEGMLSRARDHAKKLGITHVEFLHSDLEQIPVPDQTCDLVISNCTINHAANKQRVWAEIFRILKFGGRFVVSDIYATSPVPVMYSKDPDAIAECWGGAVTRGEYIRTLVDAGFTHIRVYEESKPYSKGKVEVASITLTGRKEPRCSCCTGH